MNFDTYIQELLGNPNPKGNMLTGVSTPTDNFYTQALTSDYYNNRFKRPDSIDAGIAKRVEEDKTLYKLLGLPTASGMLGGGGGGNGGGGGGDNPIGTTPTDPDAFVDIDQINNVLSVFDALTNAVPAPVSMALSAYAAYQDPNSFINNPHSFFEQLTNPALNAHSDSSGTPQMGETTSTPMGAVTSPVNMSFSPSTPIGPMGDSSGGGFSGADAGGGGFGPSAPGGM